jgi:hypothetical protein
MDWLLVLTVLMTISLLIGMLMNQDRTLQYLIAANIVLLIFQLIQLIGHW